MHGLHRRPVPSIREQAAEGTVLALGTDFTITEFTYSIDNGLCCFAGRDR